MIFPHRLRALREETGRNQKDFAEWLSVEQSKYNKWENGKNSPDYETLCLLAQRLETTTDYLLGVSEVRFLKPDGGLLNWEDTLIARANNCLITFLRKHHAYISENENPSLSLFITNGILGSLSYILEAHDAVFDGLKADAITPSECERISQQYRRVVDRVYWGGRHAKNGVIVDGHDSFFDIIPHLENYMASSVAGYAEYREQRLNEQIEAMRAVEGKRVDEPKEEP